MSQLLPYAENEEKALLGAFLRHPLEIGGLCSARGFSGAAMHLPANSVALDCLLAMWTEQKPIDAITLSQELSKRNQLTQAGGIAHLMTLGDYMPSMQLAEQYLQTLEEKRALRSIITTCSEIGQRAQTEQDNVDGLIGELSGFVTALATTSTRTVRTMKQLLKEKAERLTSDEPPANTVKTGLEKIDTDSPLCMGDMPIISGETKSGKTMLALTIGANIAIRENRPVLYFSLEDSAEKPIDRIVAGLARIPVEAHHHSKVSQDGYNRLNRAIEQLATSRLVIRDDIHDLGGIIATARQFRSKHPTAGAMIVDYAQLVVAPTKKGDTREREIATISRAFRLLAIELQTPVIVLSQLNADGATRESKALENDMTAHWQVQLTDDANKRMLVIPRQRNGASGIGFPLSFFGQFARFENYAGADTETEPQQFGKKKK